MPAKKSATKAAPSLSKLQKSLNTDTRLRNQFLKDPAGVLAKNGVELPPEKATQLSQFTQQAAAGGGKAMVGGIKRNTLGAGANARVEVEVSVTVRF